VAIHIFAFFSFSIANQLLSFLSSLSFWSGLWYHDHCWPFISSPKLSCGFYCDEM